MRTAVVLFNLGGPFDLQSVTPFLFNLFSDPAILSLPNPWRLLLARLLAHLRTPKARVIYSHLGGKSPLLGNTKQQASALLDALGKGYEVFVSMRYWSPRAKDVLQEIKQYQPQQMILLPLYPQYSTATTRSSLMEFNRLRLQEMPSVPCKIVQSFPKEDGFIQALADLIKKTLQNVKQPYKLLFTAHGLPLKTIQKGDPYQTQIEETVEKVVSFLEISPEDYQVCYQSRIGFLPWLQPYTIDEIKKAGKQQKAVVLVPIGFVAENSETLFELDIQYKEVANKTGVLGYYRVPTVSTHPLFIQGLATLVKEA